MSNQPVSGIPAGELAIAQRVAQLQALIESTRQLACGETSAGATAAASTSAVGTTGAGSDFASALQAASASDNLSTTSAQSATAPLTGGESGESGGYEALIDQAAARNGLEPAVLHGLIEQESGFDPSATSGAGAAGLTQLMPGTASSLGVANSLDPAESIEGGARYLGELMHQFSGNTSEALAAYNAGPGAVQEYGGIPPYSETESYVSKVLGDAESYRQAHPETTGALL